MERRDAHLRWAAVLLASGALSACTHDDGDRYSDLDGKCLQEWDYWDHPEPACESALLDHIGLDPETWEGDDTDLEYISKGLWAFARAPIDLEEREEMYSTVVSGIVTTVHGRSAIRLGRARMDVDHGVAMAACTVIHEGRHSSYGDHDVGGKYDIGMDGPHGWCIRFAESFAKLEVDDGEAAYVAERKRLYLK